MLAQKIWQMGLAHHPLVNRSLASFGSFSHKAKESSSVNRDRLVLLGIGKDRFITPGS